MGWLALLASGCSGNEADLARQDGVVCSSGLEELPPEDMPWVLDQLFRRAKQFVFAAVPAPAELSKPPRRHRSATMPRVVAAAVALSRRTSHEALAPHSCEITTS